MRNLISPIVTQHTVELNQSVTHWMTFL